LQLANGLEQVFPKEEKLTVSATEIPDSAQKGKKGKGRIDATIQRVRNTTYFLLFDLFRIAGPGEVARRWRGLPSFFRNSGRWRQLGPPPSFRIRFSDAQFRTFERFENAGIAKGDYFLQDLWAARRLYQRGVRKHVDVASRIDGFVAHVLPFAEVEYVDLRPLESEIEGLRFVKGSILDLPYAASSVGSLSCLHVIEHIGLGRYGDAIDPMGYLKAARELVRVLAPGGELLIGTPVGRERLVFDAHRIFDPQTILDAFEGLELQEFSLIDGAGTRVREGVDIDEARRWESAHGLFVFTKRRQEV
jgi:SAM-dependent methyltransferase